MVERDEDPESGLARPVERAGEPGSGWTGGAAADDLSRDESGSSPEGMPSTVGPADSSLLATLAQSIGRVPRIRLHDTGVDEDGRAGEGSPPFEPSAGSGRLKLFGVLGRGGMGVVLKAHDPDLGRDLAVKVLREPLHDQPEMVRRFVEEAQIGGQLQHPGIVPVYELGSLADRRPYIAMRLVKGRTLAELLEARAGPADGLPGLVGIFESVCQTMAYAHARGVIHRDLKPSNIMVGSFGEVQVMDWGLAKVLAGAEPYGGAAERPDGEEAKVATGRSAVAVDASRPGSVLGTPAYMAPEQARGDVDATDERADVFALGSILCEILTGQAAFTGKDWAEIEGRAARGEVSEAMGRLASCGAEAGLIGLAGDCLAAEVSARPRDARAVAIRVTAYRAGAQERLRAAELARVEAQARAEEEAKRRGLADRLAVEAQARAVGELRRRQLAVALAASVVGLLVIGGGSSGWLLYQRQAWRSRVAVALKEAEVLRDQALDDPAGDLGRWQAARTAVRRLHDLRDVGHSRDVGVRVDALDAQVERGARAAEADRRLLDRLEEVRAGMVADDQADAAFAEAFARAGYDPGGPSGDPEALGRLLAGRPRAVALAAASALDTWAVVRRHVDRARPQGRGADPDGARRLLAAARAADPDPWRNALRDSLAAGAADSLLRLADDPELDRRGPVGLWLLGHSLEMTGAHDRALDVLRRARRAYPDDYWLNVELGLASLEGVRSGLGATSSWYTSQGTSEPRFQRAEPYFMAAVALRPRLGPAHLLLASAMLNQEKWDEAFAEFREALRLQPDDPATHNSLGMAYRMRGEPDRADAEFREAIRLLPAYTIARGNLGDLLLARGRPEEAAAVFRETIRLLPGFAPAHAWLAHALARRWSLEEAVASYREAIRLAPRYALAYAGLGGVLRQLGDYDGAAAAIRTAFEIQSDPQWQALMRQELARTERRAALASRLPGMLQGADRPAGGTEALEFAYLARERIEFAGAARLFAQAFRIEPRLADDLDEAHRYNAACSAALAAAGRSRGEPHPAPSDATRSRRLALEWLRGDLAARSAVRRDGQASDKARLVQFLGHCRVDDELADVRSAPALDRLPEVECREWQALWAEVDSLIGSMKDAPAGSPAPPSRGFLPPG